MEHLNDPNQTAMDGLHDEPCDEPWWDDGPSEDPDHVWFRQCSDATQLYARIWNHQFYADSIVAGSFLTLLLRLCKNRAVLSNPDELSDLHTLVKVLEGLGVPELSPLQESPPLKSLEEVSLEIDIDSLFAIAHHNARYDEDRFGNQRFFASRQPKREKEALEIDIDSKGEPFGLETVCNYTGIKGEDIANILITMKRYMGSYPVAIVELLDIAWIKEGTKGRGHRNEFRRAKAPQFDCLDHLLNHEAREVHRSLLPGKKSPTVRMLLRKVRNEIFPVAKPVKKSHSTPDPDAIAKSKPKPMPEAKALAHCEKNYGGFYSSYGIYFNGRNGIAIDNDGKVIKSLFAGSAWEGGLHAKMMRGLRQAKTISWDKLNLPYPGECTLIPWNSLIIDFDESRD